MAKDKKSKPPVDEDVLYLDADNEPEGGSMDDILKEAQASADRMEERQKAARSAAEVTARPGSTPEAPDAAASVVFTDASEEITEVIEEEEEAAAPPSALALRVAELTTENERLKDELRENRDGLIRKQADYENFRKRMQRDKEDFEKYAHGAVLKEILPVLDNLERALMVDPSADAGSLRQGVELVFKQMKDGLTRFGLREVVAIGQEFDPNVHEAVASETNTDLPPNTVVSELQRGYLHHDRLLRAAFVKVAMGGPTAASTPPPASGDGNGAGPGA